MSKKTVPVKSTLEETAAPPALGIQVDGQGLEPIVEAGDDEPDLTAVGDALRRLADQADRLSPKLAQAIRQARQVARDEEAAWAATAERGRQTAAPTCGYCNQPMVAYKSEPTVTRYRCRTDGCTNTVKQARPRRGQATLEGDFSAR